MATNCFYCNQPLSVEHTEQSKKTGQYVCTWKGDISCKKCFFLTPAETQKFYRAAEKSAALRKRKLVPILTIPMKLKVVVGKPIRSR
jgi:hypothetical protein